jgi:hypothetical protein
METRLRFISPVSSPSATNFILPVYGDTILALKALAQSGEKPTIFEVLKRLKNDVGSFINFQAFLSKKGLDQTLDPNVEVSLDLVNDFINHLKNCNTDFLELKKIQTSAFKIGSFLTSFVQTSENHLLFTDWIYPYSVFLANSFLAPTWLERVLSKGEGEFLNVLGKCIQHAPFKPNDVCEVILCNKELISKITTPSSESVSLLRLGAALEPCLFWRNSINLISEWSNFHLTYRNYLSADFIDLALEKFCKKWQLSTNLDENTCLTRSALVEQGKKFLADFYLRKNHTLVRNFDCETSLLEKFFGELKEGSPSIEGLRILIQEIAPQIGIEWLVIFLRDTKFLIPKLKWGVRMDFSPHPISLNSCSQVENFIISALEDLKVTKGGELTLYGLECCWYAVGFDNPNHKGVILAGFQLDDTRTVEVETYKRIANFRDLFSMALGYCI